MPSRISPPSSRLITLLCTTITLLTTRSLSNTTAISAATTSTNMPKKLFTTSNPTPTLPSMPAPIPSTFLDNLPLPSVLVFDLDYTLWPFWVDTHCNGPLKPATPTAAKNADSYNSAMLDRDNESFSFYPQVPTILAAARARGITMSVASRTHAPDMAMQMLRGLYVPPLPAQEVGAEAAGSNSQTHADGTVTNGFATYANGDSQHQHQAPLTLADLHGQHAKEPATTPQRALSFFSYPQMYPGSKVAHFLEIQKQTRKQRGKEGEVAFADMLFFDDEARNRDVEKQLGVTFALVRDGVTVEEVDKGVREWRRRRRAQAGA